MTLLQASTHGNLELYDSLKAGKYYSSDYSYEGLDSATVLVEVGGYKVKVIYRFVLMKNVPGSSDQGTATDDKKICPNGYRWKISTMPDGNGNITVSSVEYLTPDAGTSDLNIAASATSLGSAVLNKLTGDTSGVAINMADLPGAAVGQAVGSTITLDINGAGYGSLGNKL